MKATDFAKGYPGRLVPTEEGALAFVPSPIPRRIEFEPRTLRLLSAADDAVGRLGGIIGRLVNPYLVAFPLLRREAILSSRIEGTLTTAEDLVLLEAAEKPPVPLHSNEADTREVANYMKAMEQDRKS